MNQQHRDIYKEPYRDHSPIDDVREFIDDDGILYECTYKGNLIWKVEECETHGGQDFTYDAYYVSASEFASTRTLMREINIAKGIEF